MKGEGEVEEGHQATSGMGGLTDSLSSFSSSSWATWKERQGGRCVWTSRGSRPFSCACASSFFLLAVAEGVDVLGRKKTRRRTGVILDKGEKKSITP